MPSGMTGGSPAPASSEATLFSVIGSFSAIGTITPRSMSCLRIGEGSLHRIAGRPVDDAKMVFGKAGAHRERLCGNHHLDVRHFDLADTKALDRPIHDKAGDRGRQNCHDHHDQRAMLLLHDLSLRGQPALRFASLTPREAESCRRCRRMPSRSDRERRTGRCN